MFSRPSAIRLAISAALALFLTPSAALRIEVLKSIGGVPPHIVSAFEEPIAFQQVANGQYFVFDRRGHTVYGIDAKRTAAWKLIQIGSETGRVIEPVHRLRSGFGLRRVQSSVSPAGADVASCVGNARVVSTVS